MRDYRSYSFWLEDAGEPLDAASGADLVQPT